MMAWTCCGHLLSINRTFQRVRERVASGSRIARTSCGPIVYGIAGHGPTVLVVHRRHVFGARFIGYPSGDHLWVGHQQRPPRFLE